MAHQESCLAQDKTTRRNLMNWEDIYSMVVREKLWWVGWNGNKQTPLNPGSSVHTIHNVISHVLSLTSLL